MATLSARVRSEPAKASVWAPDAVSYVPGRRASRADASLLGDVERYGKFDASCLNCGGCSVVCDLAVGGVTFPRGPIHLVVVGLRDAVLEGLEPWLCHDCGDCSLTCPRKADPAASMRTLRRYLTGQYDPTGLASRILRSRLWHTAALLSVGGLVFGLFLWYHLSWVELPVSALAMPLDMGHMFPMILYVTWVVYALPALVLLGHVWRMYRLTLGWARPPLHCFLAELKALFVHVTTQWQMRKCPAEAHGAPVVSWWIYAGHGELVPRRWLKHWLMVVGTVGMVVLTAAFLRWFQTDELYPLHHPQRWLGYVATASILWGATDVLIRRLRRPKDPALRKPGALTLPALLWLTAVSGIVLHALRYLELPLAAHYAYAVHLAITIPMVVVEVPFGDWAHMIDRPLALYFQAVRQRAREERAGEPGPVLVST